MENSMKVRLHGNSIRLRLTRPEVAQFAETGRVEDAVDFGNGAALTYSLERSSTAAATRVAYSGRGIAVQLPGAVADEWTGTDRVGISGEQAIGEGRSLTILVEKDFKCVHNSSEQDEDAYPNPLLAQ
jgi:hypothetical protein